MTRAALVGLVGLTAFNLLLVVFSAIRDTTTIAISAAIFALAAGALVAHVVVHRKRRAQAPFTGTEGSEAVFDDRAVRRAVWRGVLRTALAAVVWGVAGLVALQVASGLWQSRGSRQERFRDVYEPAFVVAHPGYVATSSGCCNASFGSTSVQLELAELTAGAVKSKTSVKLSFNLLGRLERKDLQPLPETPVDVALRRLPLRGSMIRQLLARLPDAVQTVALVELRRPAGRRAFEEVLARHGRRLSGGFSPFYDVPPIFLEPPYRHSTRIYGTFPDRILTWPEPGSLPGLEVGVSSGSNSLTSSDSDSLAQFQAWAAKLQGGDDENLDRLSLPPSAVIKRIARHPKVYGFILEGASKTELLAYLNDAAIRSVNVADVAFDLTPGVVETATGEHVPYG